MPEPTIIRAEPGKPWPEPPAGGRWSRDPDTGDLTLVQPAAVDTEESRRRRREQQRARALAAGAAPATQPPATGANEE